MIEFKIGDRVTPINVDRYTQYDRHVMESLIGRTMIVSATSVDEKQREIIHAAIPGDLDRRWHAEDLMMAPKIVPISRNFQPDIGQKRKKPLKFGHIVEFDGDVWIVLSEAEDMFGEYEIGSLTGSSNVVHKSKLTRIGSIRKKVKGLKAQMGGEHTAAHHHGSKHSEYVKRTQQVMASYREELKRSNELCAELLDVLEYCRNKIAYMQAHGEWYSPGRAIEMADAAIAKARGEDQT